MLVESGVWVDGIWEWNLAWRRNLFECEKVSKSQLLLELQGLRMERDLDDSWVWKDDESSSYSVNSVYAFLRDEIEEGNNFMYVKFWRTKALSSTHITAWRVLENNLHYKEMMK